MFSRFAVYIVPDAHDPLYLLASQWLGWDSVYQQHMEAPSDFSHDIWQSATTQPRKYGFHATMKAPFVLQKDKTIEQLELDVGNIAQSINRFTITVRLESLRGFIALTLQQASSNLVALEKKLVTELDQYRTAAGAGELARRRQAGLTPRQERLLCDYGYPYVLDEFKFHMTLTGRLTLPQEHQIYSYLEGKFPSFPYTIQIPHIALMGEQNGRFVLIKRFPLSF